MSKMFGSGPGIVGGAPREAASEAIRTERWSVRLPVGSSQTIRSRVATSYNNECLSFAVMNCESGSCRLAAFCSGAAWYSIANWMPLRSRPGTEGLGAVAPPERRSRKVPRVLNRDVHAHIRIGSERNALFSHDVQPAGRRHAFSILIRECHIAAGRRFDRALENGDPGSCVVQLSRSGEPRGAGIHYCDSFLCGTAGVKALDYSFLESRSDDADFDFLDRHRSALIPRTQEPSQGAGQIRR